MLNDIFQELCHACASPTLGAAHACGALAGAVSLLTPLSSIVTQAMTQLDRVTEILATTRHQLAGQQQGQCGAPREQVVVLLLPDKAVWLRLHARQHIPFLRQTELLEA